MAKPSLASVPEKVLLSARSRARCPLASAYRCLTADDGKALYQKGRMMATNKKQKSQRQQEKTQDMDGTLPAEVSLEELEEATTGYEQDLAKEYISDTQHTDGSTYDPTKADEQGLVYTPPTDPPVLPGGGPQGAEVAAGFSPSMEESDPDVEILPERVDDNDLDIEEDVAEVLRVNSETSHLDQINVRVRDGVVYLTGTVFSNDDIEIVEEIVSDMVSVVDVRNYLQVAEAPST